MKNMKVIYSKMSLVMLLFVATCTITSCKDDNDEQNYVMTNQEFVDKASSSNNFEVAAGALALSKDENAAVKQYGSHMVNDHTTAGAEMKTLAAQKGWTVPDALQQKEQQNLDKLAGLNAAAFDKAFSSIMVQSHQDAVALFETAANQMGVPDADLSALAAAKLPTLKAHLEEAVALNAKVNP
jgi:putative membrane protein